MDLADVIALVEEKCDGRSLGIEKHRRWANLIRSRAANSVLAAGFHGLYFLYKEAIVTNGSEAGEPRYELPDDFLDDLSVWYDGVLLVKADPGVMDVTVRTPEGQASTGCLPTWYDHRGLEINIIPTPEQDGKEIKLFYNGKPEVLTDQHQDTFSDYFLENWTDLHVYGMAEYALQYVGAHQASKIYQDLKNSEIAALTLKNRQFWVKGVKIRFQNWDEFQDKQRYLFPQFGNLIRTEETVT